MALTNVIILTGDGRYHEDLAGAAGILPGMLVMPTGAAIVNGVQGTAVVHATAGGDTGTRVALADTLQGLGNDTAYTSGQPMPTYTPTPGSVLQLRLTFGVSYDEGDILISAGDGTLKKTTGTPDKVFARVREAIDYTSEATTPGLGKVTVA